MTSTTAPTSGTSRATGGARWIPGLTLGIAAAHLVLAAISFRSEWSGILADGLWNSVPDADHVRVAALWFAVGGAGLAGLGLLARSSVRATGSIPPEFAVIMLALGVPVAMMVPVSGGWFLIALGVAALAGRRRHGDPVDAGS